MESFPVLLSILRPRFVLMIKLVCGYQTDRRPTDRCRSFAPTYVVKSRTRSRKLSLASACVHSTNTHAFPSIQPRTTVWGTMLPSCAVPTSVNLIICRRDAHRCVSMVILNPINHHVTFGSSSTTVLGPSYVLLSHPEVW